MAMVHCSSAVPQHATGFIIETLQSLPRPLMQLPIIAGKPADWDRIFKGYSATQDFPACTFYQELMTQYPDAKVVLTVRDPDKWYNSALATIYQIVKASSPACMGPQRHKHVQQHTYLLLHQCHDSSLQHQCSVLLPAAASTVLHVTSRIMPLLLAATSSAWHY